MGRFFQFPLYCEGNSANLIVCTHGSVVYYTDSKCVTWPCTWTVTAWSTAWPADNRLCTSGLHKGVIHSLSPFTSSNNHAQSAVLYMCIPPIYYYEFRQKNLGTAVISLLCSNQISTGSNPVFFQWVQGGFVLRDKETGLWSCPLTPSSARVLCRAVPALPFLTQCFF